MEPMSIEKIQDEFCDMYDTLCPRARQVMTEKFKDFSVDIESFLIPYSSDRIEKHFEDPDTESTGTVSALKFLCIPLSIFHSIQHLNINEDQFRISLNTRFLNPVSEALSAAMEEKKKPWFKLFIQFEKADNTTIESYNAYILFSGVVQGESGYPYDLNINSVYLEDKDVEKEDAVVKDIENQTGKDDNTVIQDDTKKDAKKKDISEEGAFLRVSIPDGLKTANDMISYLKRAGIEKTIKLRLNELNANGYEPLSFSKYHEMRRNGTSFDKDFKNDMYITYSNGKADLKSTKEYQIMELAGTCVVFGLYNSISAVPDKKYPFSLNKNVRYANKGYKLKRVWIAVYNPRTKNVIHKPIAKSSKIFGVKVEGFSVALEGLFSDNSDWGLSCDPHSIQKNKYTYLINDKTGKVDIGMAYPPGDEWYQFLTPFQSRNIGNNIRDIYYKFQSMDNGGDWDLYTYNDYKSADGSKALLEVLKNFKCYKFSERFTDNANRSYDGFNIFKLGGWIYGCTIVANILTIRPTGCTESEYHYAHLSDIYLFMYNSATHKIATPLLASEGLLWLTQLGKPSASFRTQVFGDKKPVKGIITKANMQEIPNDSTILDKTFIAGKPVVPLVGKLALSLKEVIANPTSRILKPSTTIPDTTSEGTQIDLTVAKEKLIKLFAQEHMSMSVTTSFNHVNKSFMFADGFIGKPKGSVSFEGAKNENIGVKIHRLQDTCDTIVEESGSLKALTVRMSGDKVFITGTLA